jgi:hypothetical protein
MNPLDMLDHFVESQNGFRHPFRMSNPNAHVHVWIATSHPEVSRCTCGMLANRESTGEWGEGWATGEHR